MEQKRVEGMATTSLVLGILSFVILSVLGAIPAVVCGHIAKSRIKKDPEALEGGGRATAGLILGYLHILLLPVIIIVVGMMAAISVPMMSANKDRAIQCEALAEIGAISTASMLYQVEKGRIPTSVNDLISADLLMEYDLNGTYYTIEAGWDSVVFDPMNGRVQSATLTDTRGVTKEFVYNPVSGRIEVQ